MVYGDSPLFPLEYLKIALITQRSQVRIPPPLPFGITGLTEIRRSFFYAKKQPLYRKLYRANFAEYKKGPCLVPIVRAPTVYSTRGVYAMASEVFVVVQEAEERTDRHPLYRKKLQKDEWGKLWPESMDWGRP